MGVRPCVCPAACMPGLCHAWTDYTDWQIVDGQTERGIVNRCLFRKLMIRILTFSYMYYLLMLISLELCVLFWELLCSDCNE